MKKAYTLGIGFLLCILLWVLYMSWFFAVISLCISLLLYSAIAYILVSVYSFFRKREPQKYLIFLPKFFWSLGVSLWTMWVFFGWFMLYQNDVSPAKMPVYTLSNGEKTIIFQWMSHIGTPDFYKKVQENIYHAKENWYVLFFEWVLPWSWENEEKFNQIMWIQFDKTLYENFSKIYGVVAQNNDDFLGLVNDQDFNIDISVDDIIAIYNEKYGAHVQRDSPIIDAGKEISQILSELNEQELKLLVYINQSILNTIIKYDWLRESLLQFSGNTHIFDVILNDRNVHLVEEIKASQYDKIVITYGLMHFPWVYALLQKGDPRWEIIWEEYLYPVQ